MQINDPYHIDDYKGDFPPLPPTPTPLSTDNLETQNIAKAQQFIPADAAPSLLQGNILSAQLSSSSFAKKAQPPSNFFSSLITFLKNAASNVFKTASSKIKELENTATDVLQTVSFKPIKFSKLSSQMKTRLNAIFDTFLPKLKHSIETSNPKAVGDEEMSKPCLRGRNQYAVCEKSFIDKQGNLRGSETIERIKSVEMRQANLKAKIVNLEERVSSNSSLKKELETCKNELKLCEEHLSQELDWIDSNHSRDVLTGGQFVQDRNKIIPVAVNLRKQTADVNGSTESFLRFGAVWDPRSGLTHMKELNSLYNKLNSCVKLTSDGDGEESQRIAKDLNEEIRQKIQQLENIKTTSSDQKEAIQDAIKSFRTFQVMLDETGAIDISKLHEAHLLATEIIKDRRQFLRNQLLEPTLMQLRDKYDESGTLKIMHLGLLNSIGPLDFQSSGWAHKESNQINDMHAAFMDLNDCKIVFLERSDVGGSYFEEDDQGKPILYVNPKDLDTDSKTFDGVGKKVKIETCFMNISPQDQPLTKPKNEGLQREINEQALQKLYDWAQTSPDKDTILPKLNAIKERLNTGESSFKLAAELLMVAKNFTAISEGCLSCKDRGGTVAEMFVIRMIKEKADGIGKASLRKWHNEMFSKKSPLVQVVNDCTGAIAAKVNFALISDMSKWQRIRANINIIGAHLGGGLNVQERETAAPAA